MERDDRMISFAGERPAEDLAPREALREAERLALAAQRGRGGGRRSGRRDGAEPLRERLCGLLSARAMNVSPGQMLLTAGAEQTLGLLARTLGAPGDAVVVEEPADAGSLRALRESGLRPVAAACDEHGMQLADAERLLHELRPAFVYAAPTFGSPTGRAWSAARRAGLLALCRRCGVPIVEDDRYGALRFDPAAAYPTILSLAESVEEGAVVYTGTFASSVAPALRTGWAVGSRALMRRAAAAKPAERPEEALARRTLEELLRRFDPDDYLRAAGVEYGARMRRLTRLLAGRMPAGTRWTEPQGGLFLWLRLPEGLDAEALQRGAARMGVSLAPGAPFFAGEPQRGTARLSAACAAGRRLADGVERLAEAIEAFTARS